MTLPVIFKGYLISCCVHAETGWLAVCDHEGRKLDFFTANGEHIDQVKLNFRPKAINAVAAVIDWIIIVSDRPAKLNVYN